MSVTISGDTGVSAVQSGAVDLTTDVTGVLPNANGGTGTATFNTSFKNRIINGAMQIDQRNAGASVTPSSSSYTLDRWQAFLPDVASKFSVQQSSTAPIGFVNSLLATSTSSYSVGAGERFAVRQMLEGNNIADLGWGTANASPVTLSFWVRSSLTGTFGGALQNSAANRSYPFSFTISSANTFEYKTITIAGDTTGTWLTDNGIGIRVFFGLGVGTTYSGTAGAWAGADYRSATGATSVVGTSGATFYITGVQLEKGSTATSFDYRPYGQELALCQRYYELTSTFAASRAGGNRTDTTNLKYQVTKRASPTVAIFGTPIANSGTNTISGTQLDNVYLTGAGVFVGTLSANAEL